MIRRTLKDCWRIVRDDLRRDAVREIFVDLRNGSVPVVVRLELKRLTVEERDRLATALMPLLFE